MQDGRSSGLGADRRLDFWPLAMSEYRFSGTINMAAFHDPPSSPLLRWGTRITRSGDAIPFKLFEPRPLSVAELLADSARFGGREYVVQGDCRLTFSAVLDATYCAAAALSRRRLGRGDRVMLMAANSPDWVIAFWAILQSGATVMLGNSWWSGVELAHAIELGSPDLILSDERALERLPSGAPVTDLGSFVEESASRERPVTGLPQVDESDTALILFTSGTTGMPKGAMLSQRALVALEHSLLHVTHRLPQDGILPEPEVTLQTGPLFHMGGVQALLLATVLGQTMLLLPGRFSPSAVLESIEHERVTRWGGVPTMIIRVLNDPSVATRDLSSLRSVTLGGAPVSEEVGRRLREVFPNVSRGVTQIYGMSEAGGTLTAASGRDSVERPGTAGRALPLVDLRIDDPDEHGLGEIRARTPTQMSGYLGLPNDPMIDSDGWLATGDLGYIDADGYLFVTGRAKDMIIRGGENIAAAHVEAEILSHPDIVDAAVVALPDDDLGEIVGAAVLVRDGVAVGADGLRQFLIERLAYFEVPEVWWFRGDMLPVNRVGKVDKRRLRDEWPKSDDAAPASSAVPSKGPGS